MANHNVRHTADGAKRPERVYRLSNYLPAHPVPPKTVSRRASIAVGIAAFVFGLVAGGVGGNDSELAAANKRVGQLEAQLTAGGAQASAGEAGSPEAAPSAEAVPTVGVTLSGDGKMNSKKVTLEGDYGVSWTTLGSCYYSADLKDGGAWGKSVFTADEALSGTGNVYGLQATDYYLDVITGPAPGCGWSVTLTPIT